MFRSFANEIIPVNSPIWSWFVQFLKFNRTPQPGRNSFGRLSNADLIVIIRIIQSEGKSPTSSLSDIKSGMYHKMIRPFTSTTVRGSEKEPK